MSATTTAVTDLLAAGVARETVAAALVMGALVVTLAADPEIAAMAAANDAERFAEGFKSPAMQAKVTQALVALRAEAVAA